MEHGRPKGTLQSLLGLVARGWLVGGGKGGLMTWRTLALIVTDWHDADSTYYSSPVQSSTYSYSGPANIPYAYLPLTWPAVPPWIIGCMVAPRRA